MSTELGEEMVSFDTQARWPRLIFFLAVGLGVAGLAIAGSSPEQKIICGLTVMVFYGVWVWRCIENGKNVEQYADSLYFLGFILTLVSLSLSVWDVVGKPEAEVNQTSLIGLFGTGLVTTVFGLVGKIALSQFAASSDQNVRDAQDRISSSFMKLSHEIDDYCGQVSRVRRQLDDEMRKLAATAQESIGTLAERSLAEIKAMSHDTRGLIEEALRLNNGLVDEAKTQLRECVRDLQKELEEFHGSLRAHVEMEEAQKESAKALTTTMKDVSKQYKMLVRSFEETMNAIREPITLMRGDFEGISAATQNATAEIKTIAGLLAEQLNIARELSGQLRADSDMARSRKEALTALLKESDQAVQTVFANLQANSEYIVQKLGS